MPLSAHAIAAALRQRQPGMGVKKVHKLLYYAQGHHLATFGYILSRYGGLTAKDLENLTHCEDP